MYFVNIVCKVTFEVSMQVNSCPEDQAQWRRTVDIYPVGLVEKLTVHVDLMCQCDCEQSQQKVSSMHTCHHTHDPNTDCG